MEIDTAYLPEACGVYLFKAADDSVLYVGKALDIRSRVRSHLNDRKNPKEQKLAQASIKVDWIATASELEALVLEDTLIKRYRPRFNVRLKDDKSYPYLLITNEQFPAVLQVRGLHREQGEHFGPHGDPRAVRRSLRWLRRFFKVRSCRRSLSRPSRPCLEHHLGRCMAPCKGDIDRSAYLESVEGLRRFLSGRKEEVIADLEREMWGASASESYEKAALLRDLVGGLKRIREGQKVLLLKDSDLDAVFISGDLRGASVVQVRDGRVVDLLSFHLEGDESLSSGGLDFISSFYNVSGTIPPKVILEPFDISAGAKSDLERFLSLRRGGDVLVRAPRGDDERSLIGMARKNTELFLSRKEIELGGREVLLELKERLSLRAYPSIIDAFDISHLSGTGTVASMVEFRDGKPYKTGYRRFRIRTAGNDDTGAIHEAVERRFSRLLEDGSLLPGLVLIDGGKGQLRSGLAALKELGLEDGPSIVSIAKREELLFVPGRAEPIALKRSDRVLRLLQRIRDESHRFALSYQRKLRKVDLDLLKDIKGMGDARSKKVMASYKSIDEVANALPAELSRRCSIPLDVAERVVQRVRNVRIKDK